MTNTDKNYPHTSNVLLTVVGPTACGKTRRAVQLAKAFNGEILSADSRQVYKGMDIGTGKDLEEYGDIRAHLLDLLPAGQKYNLHRFLRDLNTARADIEARGKLAVLCGGTGMYVEAALNGLVLPEVPADTALRTELEGKSLTELTNILSGMKRLHNTTDVDTPKRAIRAIEIERYYLAHPEKAEAARTATALRPKALVIGLDIPREERRNRISRRLHQRLDNGMIEEVKGLLDTGIAPEDLIYYGLEYKYLTLHLIGELSREEMERQLEIAIHQFAKRQMTWFRGMEKRGHHIHWLPWDMPSEAFISTVGTLLADIRR